MEDGENPILEAFRAKAAEVQRRRDAHEIERGRPEYVQAAKRIQQTATGFAATLEFCVVAATRAPEFVDRSLFLRSVDDLASSAVMAAFAFGEGGLNAGRRELRFLLELAVQSAYTDAQMGQADFDTRLAFFERKTKHNSVDHIKDLGFPMLGDLEAEYRSAVTKAWATASSYVHPTPRQLREKLELRARGISPGFETAQEMTECARALFEATSLAVVLAFHVVGQAFTGDLLEDGLDGRDDWPFHASRFVAAVDASFDYKHERQDRLVEIQARRASRITD